MRLVASGSRQEGRRKSDEPNQAFPVLLSAMSYRPPHPVQNLIYRRHAELLRMDIACRSSTSQLHVFRGVLDGPQQRRREKWLLNKLERSARMPLQFMVGIPRYQDDREYRERFSDGAHKGYPVTVRHVNITHDQIQHLAELFN